METINNICPISKRRYEQIPVDKVKVINSRNRDREQFEMNVESIDSVGLLKPIRVNDKFLGSSGLYELICGEGRLLAHKQLGRDKVHAATLAACRVHRETGTERPSRRHRGTPRYSISQGVPPWRPDALPS